jgi:hypothetical protein
MGFLQFVTDGSESQSQSQSNSQSQLQLQLEPEPVSLVGGSGGDGSSGHVEKPQSSGLKRTKRTKVKH